MKLSVLFVFLGTLIPLQGHASDLNWAQLFQGARKTAEATRISEARLNQAKERKSQSLGALFPQLTARYSYQEIDPPPGQRSAFTRINQYSTLLNLTQPLFRGGSEYAAYRFTKEDILLNQYQQQGTDLAIYQNVINDTFVLWMARVDVDNLKLLEKYSLERVVELRERSKVGRSRKGELLQAEAQYESVKAQLAEAGSALIQAEANFNFTTGTEATSLSFPGVKLTDTKPGALGEYLTRAHGRADLKARQQEAQLAEEQIGVNKGGHLPNIDLTSNYYFNRTGVLADSEWDIGVTVSLPIYRGGMISSQVREATERKREAILNYENMRRMVERDVQILWRNLQQLQRQSSDLNRALVKARVAYEENQREYRYGLVTNLDVLQAMNLYVDTKRSYDRAVLMTQMTDRALTAATGELP